jgi:cell division protein FtsA
MVGTRLETEMYLVTIGSSPAMNLRKAVEKAGYKVRELVLEPLASALSVLTEDEKELGVALVEMGAGTTDIALFTRRRSGTSARSTSAATTSPATSCIGWA